MSRHGTPPSEILAHLPLNPRVFMVLLALVEGPTHGYEIKKRGEARSDGAVRLDVGTVYRALAQLEERGLIRESGRRPGPEDDDPRRRYYELTELGSGVLAAEADRLREMVDLVEAHGGSRPAGSSA